MTHNTLPAAARTAIAALDRRVRGVPPEVWLAFLQSLLMALAACPRPERRTARGLRRWLKGEDVLFPWFGRLERIIRERQAAFLRAAAGRWPGEPFLAKPAAQAAYEETWWGAPDQLEATVVAVGETTRR